MIPLPQSGVHIRPTVRGPLALTCVNVPVDGISFDKVTIGAAERLVFAALFLEPY